jgi:hypothetical protein
MFALFYVGLGLSLFSFTSIALMSVAMLQMIMFLFREHWKALAVTVAFIAIATGVLIERYASEMQTAGDALFLAEQAATTSQLNGFSGRFSEFGTLYNTIKYIEDRPFSPVGIGYRSDLFFGDSGPVEYYLRGSIALLLSVYGGFFFFLKRNLMSKRHLVLLFLSVMAFELGYSSLTYVRLLYMLPVLVVYFNDLSRNEMCRPSLETSCG